MTNSKTFKKLASASAAIVIAITSSISFAVPAHAAIANTVPGSFTLVSGVATYSPGTWTGGGQGSTVRAYWLICDNAYSASSGVSGSSGTNPPADCGPYALTDQTGPSSTQNNPRQFNWVSPDANNPTTIPAWGWKWMSGDINGIVTANTQLNGKYVALYEGLDTTWVMTATIAMSGLTGGTPSTPAQTPSVIAPIINLANEARSTIQNSLQTVKDKGVSAHGGRVIIDEMNAADIDTVTLNGKALKVRVSENGTSIAIPAGSKSGDLVFTLADGSKVTIYDAVNIAPSTVNPDKVAKISLPAAFNGNSTSVPAAIKKAIMKREDEILESGNAQSVGYATGSSAKAQAVALSRAKKVCGIISNINEEIEPLVKVVVNKTTARKSPVKYQIW